MEKLLALLIAGAISASASFAASFTLNGTALLNPSSLSGYGTGDTAVWVVNGGGGGAFDIAALQSLNSALSLSTGSSIGGYEVAGSNTVTGGGSLRIVGGIGSIDVSASIGDAFGLLVFDSSTTETAAEDGYTIYTDPTWVLPAGGASITFNEADQPLQLTAGGTASSVVPEPSAYALLVSLLALGCVMIRRRA
jgi:hypothetical protein